jgi:AraC family L-rhamnose operon regulatory protein RhaS
MKPRPPVAAIFRSSEGEFHADTCDPLKAAADAGQLRLSAFARCGYPGVLLEGPLLPGVASMGCWDAPRDQSWGLAWHRNEGIELTFLARGHLDFAVDEERYSLQSGQLTITRPWQQHRVGRPHVRASRLLWVILDVGVRRPNETWHWPDWLIFSPSDRSRLTTLLRQSERPVWNATPAVRDCFEAIANQLDSKCPAKVETRLKILLNELLLEVLHLLQSSRIRLEPHLSSTRRTVELFLNRLPEHVDHAWTLEEMAGHCGLGRSRFAHYCREITNLSPAKHLEQCRLQVARRLLCQAPARTVTEVALACGFGSSQYFANTFRRAYGQTPSEWRKSACPSPPTSPRLRARSPELHALAQHAFTVTPETRMI